MASNPLVTQGTLNKVRASVIVPNFPSLNITSPYMGRNFVTVALEGDLSKLIPTATGAVQSPEPFVLVSISVSILRTQSLTASWRTQYETSSFLGGINVHSDTAAFPVYQFVDGTITHFDPGAYDGEDPVSRLMISAVYPVNNDMWNFA